MTTLWAGGADFQLSGDIARELVLAGEGQKIQFCCRGRGPEPVLLELPSDVLVAGTGQVWVTESPSVLRRAVHIFCPSVLQLGVLNCHLG